MQPKAEKIESQDSRKTNGHQNLIAGENGFPVALRISQKRLTREKQLPSVP
jgi:hypothetical protein